MEAKASSQPDQKAVFRVQRRESINRVVEINLWFMASIVVAGRATFEMAIGVAPPIEVFSVRYLELLGALFVFIYPFVFRLIFGALPLESLRRKRAQRQIESPEFTARSSSYTDMRAAEIHVLSDSLSVKELSTSSATELFAYYSSSSRKLSQSIYARAGVYLLVGVFVAFSGLVFFYSQTVRYSIVPQVTQLAQVTQVTQVSQAPQALQDSLPLIFMMAPKFGILFFIELVAFFFLRQYRSAMDEFRYYEAIKRSREETLALIRITTDSGKPVDPIDFVKSESFFSKAGIIAKDQSTEIIESRKLEKNELDLLEKVIDVVSRSKK